MIEIQLASSDLPDIDVSQLEQTICLVLAQLERPDVDMTLRLTDDAEMRQLNLAYWDLAATTDVLSFNGDFLDLESGRWYLGDLIISVEQAARQAGHQNHSVQDELHFLAIHGTLHLLGYDHATAEEKEEMWALQDSLYKKIQTQMEETNNDDSSTN